MNGKSTPEWLTEEVFANLSTISEDFRALALGDHDLLEFHAGAGNISLTGCMYHLTVSYKFFSVTSQIYV